MCDKIKLLQRKELIFVILYNGSEVILRVSHGKQLVVTDSQARLRNCLSSSR